MRDITNIIGMSFMFTVFKTPFTSSAAKVSELDGRVVCCLKEPYQNVTYI